MDNKKKYRDLCKQEPSIPLFSQAWWLDSLSDEGWDVAIIESKSGTIVATMPYIVKKRLGVVSITQPILTQNLGPWFRKSNANYIKKVSDQKKYVQGLISQLPEFSSFSQSWHYTRTDWLPLYWLGFSQTTKYTYLISGILSNDDVLKGFDSSYRNKIKKAQKLVEVRKGLDDCSFYNINRKTFARQGLPIPYSEDVFIKHSTAIKDNRAGEIFYAIDQEGRVHSALYLTWDSVSAYVHLVGEDPDLRNSGAGILLIYRTIEYTRDVLKLDNFDFEGSMLESIEKVRRGCSGKQVSYHHITKVNSKILKIKRLVSELCK
ncbi:GNAT family N-acetyltransferase [Vibrio mediterranei]|uniref:Methicillin resistance protein n=1 Tax=Vibrio mediterranei TaxID=689 RepID=A0ABX5DFW9_9VIBR|nr:GNAT family N-acetyltransferase [Vibrio mediterranei]PCD87716.1 methicillin resistance protein [Vibrio mediterranei]PRQ67340.1 methicillin resistance protein [Vibrio mediterranei]